MKYFLLLCLWITSSLADFEEKSILCDVDYCKDILTADPPLVCPTFSEKCKKHGGGLHLPSPDACNCCDYCIEYLEKGDKCSIGDASEMTPSSMCGPGLTCDYIKKICVPYVEMYTNATLKIARPSCAEAQYIYNKKKQDDKLGFMEAEPICDDNGEFEPFQCIPGQICYCVDKDGNRIFGETDFNDLPQYYPRCGCSRIYKTAEDTFSRAINPGEHYRCTESGDFEKIQCITDTHCLCVNEVDGSQEYVKAKPVNVTKISSETLPCFNDKIDKKGEYYKECESQYLYVMKKIEAYKKEGFDDVFAYKFPSCDLTGGYNLIQEDKEKGIKYCSYPDRTQIDNYQVKIDDPKAKDMDCKCAKANTITTTEEKPECDVNGNYKRIQCRRGKCYCVDNDGRQTLKEVDETDRLKLKCPVKKYVYLQQKQY